jgi:choline dehydrogenase
LAARLVDKKASVLLIEAGRRERLNLTHLPAMVVYTIGKKRYDWAYQTQPDPTRGGLTEAWPRGRVPGGSSAINGMIYIRGAAADYDAWEAMGNVGWGWNTVLPYFRKMETADSDTDNAYRGGMGPQRVSTLRWKHPLSKKFIESFVAAGVPFNPDPNSASHEGVAWTEGSTFNGKRISSFEAFIRPRLNDPNLHFMDGTLVERILFDGKKASGVSAVRGGKRVELNARRGVVLCAGAINSPHILMLSGIGEPSQLAQYGIKPLIESPEVGRNLMEHPGLSVRVEMDVETANSVARPIGGMKSLAQWLTSGSGFMSVPTSQVLAFLKSTSSVAEPDLQFNLFPFGRTRENGKVRIPNRNLATILVNINYPKSTGHLELCSSDPTAPVQIYPRLLDHPDDVDGVLKALDWARKIAATPPFGSHVLKIEDAPPMDAGRDADLEYIRRATVPFFHPVGTCRMGVDDRSVLTPDLKVRNAENLWVADTSIFPRHIAGNTNATAIMIGERGADLIQS